MSTITTVFSQEEREGLNGEFKRFGDTVYLDHMGSTLYAESQVKNTSETLQGSIFCNPHTSQATGDLVDQVRFKILEFFNTHEYEYNVIFTANATASIKMVAESFSFENTNGYPLKGNFYYCQDNHTSVLGMREIVKTKHQFMLTKDELLENLSGDTSSKSLRNEFDAGNSLVVFSAQCNFSGYKLPLALINRIQNYGLVNPGLPLHSAEEDEEVTHQNNHYVFLDAAAYVGSSYLDLTKYKPDFVCISFYKMFGYPTGVGALLVHKNAERVMKKKYYGGGTIDFAFTDTKEKLYRSAFHTRFEDGTLPFLSIAGLLEGFNTIERLVKATPSNRSIERISRHVFLLAKHCYEQMSKLRHANNKPVVQFYNQCGYDDIAKQGGVVAFNLLNDSGTYVGYGEVACIAALHKIILRTGCFCNLGACKSYLDLSDDTVIEQYQSGRVCGDYNDLINGTPSGAVRVSFGYMSRVSDVDRLLSMLHNYYVTVKIGDRLRFIEESYDNLPSKLQFVPEHMQPKVLEIHIYPIKSCAAFKIDSSWEITKTGFKYDRQWMIVDANGVAVTQKQNNRLCLIKPHIIIARNELQLEFDGIPNVCLSLDLENTSKTVRTSKVCRTPVSGIDCGDEVAEWINYCLETDGLRLIHQQNSSPNSTASFANHADYLVLNVASVRCIAKKLQTINEPIETTVDRFRANIIIDSKTPFEETEFVEMVINGVRFRVDGPCRRCEMICVNQRTGQKSPEVMRTIARELNGKITFGIYVSLCLQPLSQNETISCNEYVKVVRHKPEQ